MTIEWRYGRLLSDFEPGVTYTHPWEVTLDSGMVALYQASFLDATPIYSSARVARSCGLVDRPLPPLLCLNLGLSFSVHDVSEQAIAHLAYLDVRFPEPGYIGDTVRARSTVLAAAPSSSGDKGVVQVRTLLQNDKGQVLCVFQRKALVRTGALKERPPWARVTDGETLAPQELAAVPPAVRDGRTGGFGLYAEDFEPGQVFTHAVGRTVGNSEHMQLTTLLRNSHPLHFDEVYCQAHSFTKTRVVYGGLVLAWVASLTSRDLGGQALWEAGLDAGAHPGGVVAGDTLYAASKVLAVQGDRVTFRLVGIKNRSAAAAYAEHGEALFDPELAKKGDTGAPRIKEKVVEITRTLLVRRR